MPHKVKATLEFRTRRQVTHEISELQLRRFCMEYARPKLPNCRTRIANNKYRNRYGGKVTHRLFITYRFDSLEDMNEFITFAENQGLVLESERHSIKYNRRKKRT